MSIHESTPIHWMCTDSSGGSVDVSSWIYVGDSLSLCSARWVCCSDEHDFSKGVGESTNIEKDALHMQPRTYCTFTNIDSTSSQWIGLANQLGLAGNAALQICTLTLGQPSLSHSLSAAAPPPPYISLSLFVIPRCLFRIFLFIFLP